MRYALLLTLAVLAVGCSGPARTGVEAFGQDGVIVKTNEGQQAAEAVAARTCGAYGLKPKYVSEVCTAKLSCRFREFTYACTGE